MRKLLQFLYEFRALFTFLILEVVAFVFIVNYNRYHSAVFFNSSSQFAGELYEAKDGMVSYWKLGDENDSLALENAKLKKAYYTLLKEVYRDSLEGKLRKKLYEEMMDSLENEPRSFDVLSAKVVKNSVRLSHNFLTINKGKRDGVRKGMGVMNSVGVVGRVHAVSDHFSSITSLLHTRLLISSKMGKDGVLCTTKWDGEDPQFAQVLYVPSHVRVEKGDLAVTSGYDGIFPADTPIGKVEDYKVDLNSGFYEIRLKLANDFHKVHYVEVVRSVHKAEMDSIEQISL
ncbi:MAG: rod shape-determining protein MreC [Cytophagales bacterium]|nr:rod shape-determining protein MreC [Cytophagales bacterium]